MISKIETTVQFLTQTLPEASSCLQVKIKSSRTCFLLIQFYRPYFLFLFLMSVLSV